MQNKNIKIAITGGIGSGKTTVCKLIKDLGYAVISCDEIYRELINEPEFIERLAEEFGNGIVNNGKLDKTKLSSIVFSKADELKKLNNITHPEIMNELYVKAAKHKICFCEVPLLFEGGYEKEFDKVIIILRKLNDRISSIIQRDNLSTEAVENRIRSQINYDNLKLTQYYVIHNNGNLKDLSKQTAKIVQKILS